MCLPEENHSRCNSLIRKEKEKLADFIDRLRKMAMMAYRNLPDEVRRLELTESLIKSNIRRVLRASLKKTLDDKMRIHLSTGKPEMTCREVEKECIELERVRDEQKEEAESVKVTQPQHKKFVRQAQINMVAEDSDSFSSEEEVVTDFSEEEVDEEANHWIMRMEQAKKHYAKQGRKLTPQQLRTKVTQKFNRDRGRFQNQLKLH
jgi:hypothetical protein